MRRWEVLQSQTSATAADRQRLANESFADALEYNCNIENFIGVVKIPLGIVGPLKIAGECAKGEFFLPLATTEAALVASYNRGVGLISAAGVCVAAVVEEGLGRAPLFEFQNIGQVRQFVEWVISNREKLCVVSRTTTKHGTLKRLQPVINGNQVTLVLEFSTGDAAGQNMTTIATEAICEYIVDLSPAKPARFIIESNYCGDKKANARSFTTVRGRRVTAEVVVPSALVEKHLGVTAAQLTRTWVQGALGCMMSGALGIQAHFANGLAALFLATGQDAACIAECAVGITRFEVTERNELYAAVTLPNLVIGTVGGGTGLPAQSSCLRIANSFGAGNAGKFAELCAALCLAGELSLIGSISAGSFVRAHTWFARRRMHHSRRERIRCVQESAG